MRNVTSLSLLVAGLLLTTSSISAQRSLGSMTVEMSADDEQVLRDRVNRRVSISPLTTSISKTSKKVSLELHNPTDDTLEMEIKVSNTVPEGARNMIFTDNKAGKSLFEKEAGAASIYKPLDKWITKYPQKLTLAPGEKKMIDIDVSVPDSVGGGEYVSWIVAEVAPRKTLLAKLNEKKKNSKKPGDLEYISITISSSKIVYGGSDNKNNESKSEQ